MQDQHVVDLWRLLRAPFITPPVDHGKCAWELLDLVTRRFYFLPGPFLGDGEGKKKENTFYSS